MINREKGKEDPYILGDYFLKPQANNIDGVTHDEKPLPLWGRRNNSIKISEETALLSELPLIKEELSALSSTAEEQKQINNPHNKTPETALEQNNKNQNHHTVVPQELKSKGKNYSLPCQYMPQPLFKILREVNDQFIQPLESAKRLNDDISFISEDILKSIDSQIRIADTLHESLMMWANYEFEKRTKNQISSETIENIKICCHKQLSILSAAHKGLDKRPFETLINVYTDYFEYYLNVTNTHSALTPSVNNEAKTDELESKRIENIRVKAMNVFSLNQVPISNSINYNEFKQDFNDVLCQISLYNEKLQKIKDIEIKTMSQLIATEIQLFDEKDNLRQESIALEERVNVLNSDRRELLIGYKLSSNSDPEEIEDIRNQLANVANNAQEVLCNQLLKSQIDQKINIKKLELDALLKREKNYKVLFDNDYRYKNLLETVQQAIQQDSLLLSQLVTEQYGLEQTIQKEYQKEYDKYRQIALHNRNEEIKNTILELEQSYINTNIIHSNENAISCAKDYINHQLRELLERQLLAFGSEIDDLEKITDLPANIILDRAIKLQQEVDDFLNVETPFFSEFKLENPFDQTKLKRLEEHRKIIIENFKQSSVVELKKLEFLPELIIKLRAIDASPCLDLKHTPRVTIDNKHIYQGTTASVFTELETREPRSPQANLVRELDSSREISVSKSLPEISSPRSPQQRQLPPSEPRSFMEKALIITGCVLLGGVIGAAITLLTIVTLGWGIFIPVVTAGMLVKSTAISFGIGSGIAMGGCGLAGGLELLEKSPNNKKQSSKSDVTSKMTETKLDKTSHPATPNMAASKSAKTSYPATPNMAASKLAKTSHIAVTPKMTASKSVKTFDAKTIDARKNRGVATSASVHEYAPVLPLFLPIAYRQEDKKQKSAKSCNQVVDFKEQQAAETMRAKI